MSQIPMEKALRALHSAAISISQNLELEKVLQRIVDEVRQLIGARYAALGVPNEAGLLDAFIYSGLSHEQASKIPHLPRGHGLLGAIITEKRPLRVARISDDPRSAGFPVGHPPMTSFLGVPIWAGGEVIGNIYLTDKLNADAFSEADQELVEMFAAHAAVAIQNARLYEQVERLAVMEERTRIGMDLHDGVIQSIYAVGLTLESARLALPDESEEAHALLTEVAAGLNDAIRDIRNFILDLRPRRFQGDLAGGLRQLAREFQANTLVPVDLHLADGLERLPMRAARTLFLTAQEALANVARHAKANSVVVETRWQDTAVVLLIRDDGLGFDTQDKTRHVGHGLANMPARAKKLGGTFQIISAPQQGTTVKMKIPVA